MSVSPRTINENEYGAAFELTLSNPKMDKAVIVEKLHTTTPREPLTDRMESAQKRRDSHISEKKEKARVNIEQIQEKKQVIEKTEVVEISKKAEERIKSAETKRKSLIDEKVVKARAEVEKAKKMAQMKNESKEAKLQEAQKKIAETQAKVDEARKMKIQEKLEKCKVKEVVKPVVNADEIASAIEKKLSKAEENRKKQIQDKLEKCKVKPVKTKEEAEADWIKENEAKLVKKLSNASLNKNALHEKELTRLREKHEKVEMLKNEKSKKPE